MKPTDQAVGPRAGIPLEALDRDLPVRLEVIGEDIESGYTTIHDADYVEPPGDFVETTLGKALEVADEFCCDCFTVAMIDFVEE